jgi:4-amino-4-deoxychorismate mutase
MEILAPYRKRIDALDQQIIDLLHARFQIIEEVARVKAREGIDSVLPDRIEEVLDRTEAYAVARHMDGGFVRMLYRKLIERSCEMEEQIMQTTGSRSEKT